MRPFSVPIVVSLIALVAACTPAEQGTFGKPELLFLPTSAGIAGPRLTDGDGDDLVLSWMESGQAGTELNYAVYDGTGFGRVRTAVTEPRMFVNWADLPGVLHVSASHWLAHWLRYSADKTYSYDIVVSQSFDGGETWSDPIAAHTDGTPTEHGFVSLYRDPNGVALLWLDGRDTAGEPGASPLDTSMTLRAAVITSEGGRAQEQLVDDSVCDCCQTDVAITARGPVAVYRDRTATEIRDIYVTRFVNGAWETGVPVHADNWEIPGCPVNGPSIVAHGDRVAVAWFTAANNQPTVRVAFSNDSARSFSDPVDIATGRLAGYTGLAMIDSDTLAVSWVSRNEAGSNTLNVRNVSFDGLVGPDLPVATIEQLRIFPQLAYRNGSLILAWTDEVDAGREMRVARIPVL